MSWILPTALILLVGFVGIWIFSEWVVGRRHGRDDDSSAVG